MLTRWMPSIRAVFVTLLLLANLAYAMPYRGLTWKGVSAPDYGRADFEMYWGWFGAWSPVSRPTADRWFRRWAYTQDRVVHAARAPFQPVYDALHVNQRWTLFNIVARAPARLIIEVRRDGEWETLYRRLDPEHDWHEAQLSYRRIRGVWDGVGAEPKGTYKRMAKWIARTVFLEQLDVDRVRVKLVREHLSPPWEPIDPRPEAFAERYYRRHEVMP